MERNTSAGSSKAKPGCDVMLQDGAEAKERQRSGDAKVAGASTVVNSPAAATGIFQYRAAVLADMSLCKRPEKHHLASAQQEP